MPKILNVIEKNQLFGQGYGCDNCDRKEDCSTRGTGLFQPVVKVGYNEEDGVSDSVIITCTQQGVEPAPDRGPNLFKQLEEVWFGDILSPVGKFEYYVQRVNGQGGDGEVTYVYHFFTDTHRYHLVAKVGADGHSYLGCQASQRKPCAGEDHTRGSDLPDGPFTKETWNKIVAAVVGRELVKLFPFTKRLPQSSAAAGDLSSEEAGLA